MAVRGFHGTPQIAQTINTTSAGAIHRAMPIQKPKSFFVNVICSETNGCLLVGFTMHRTPPCSSSFLLPGERPEAYEAKLLMLPALGICPSGGCGF
jgi:hypothetical protein